MHHLLCLQCSVDTAERLKAGSKNTILTLAKVDELIHFTEPVRHNNNPDAISLHSWLKGVRLSLA